MGLNIDIPDLPKAPGGEAGTRSKVLWHSNAPWAPTGYGNQTALFAKRFKDAGLDVAMSCFYGIQGSPGAWEGMPVFPCEHSYDRWVPEIARHLGDGIARDVQVITLMDVWVLKSPDLASLRIASWTPIDHFPVPLAVKAYFLRTGATAIAMSRFGQDALEQVDVESLYVPHGVDTKTLRPMDRADSREMLDLPKDAFVVGMVAANKGNNPPRKAFPQAFQAFAHFRRKHPDAILYVHTNASNPSDGLVLPILAQMMGIPAKSIVFPDPFAFNVVGFPSEYMAHAYSAMDVLLSPSYGEGFGIPIVEAQACGTPPIVTDFSAMQELAGNGWKVGGDLWFDVTQGAFLMSPSVGLISDALDEAYGQAEGKRDGARRFALQYDADRVMAEFWDPVLSELGVAPSPARSEKAA